MHVGSEEPPARRLVQWIAADWGIPSATSLTAIDSVYRRSPTLLQLELDLNNLQMIYQSYEGSRGGESDSSFRTCPEAEENPSTAGIAIVWVCEVIASALIFEVTEIFDEARLPTLSRENQQGNLRVERRLAQ